ncbi:MAG: lipocalin family protein [Opitutales bacterium]|nr:lipocalin family protein [Opitutales bacterium]
MALHKTGLRCLILVLLCVLSGCMRVPDGAEPVTDFELVRYLGQWYEIARLDHRFERGLTDVRAEYSLRPDGSIRILNRGYDPEKGEWREAEGRATPAGEAGEGRLGVSFFGPFRSAYNIIALDREHYRWAMVCGPNVNYLWILSREPTLPDEIYDALVDEARQLGFPVDDLIRVLHDRADSTDD